MSATYPTAHSNAGSLIHCVRPGIKPTSSRTLCQVLNLLSHNGNSQSWISSKSTGRGHSLASSRCQCLQASHDLWQLTLTSVPVFTWPFPLCMPLLMILVIGFGGHSINPRQWHHRIPHLIISLKTIFLIRSCWQIPGVGTGTHLSGITVQPMIPLTNWVYVCRKPTNISAWGQIRIRGWVVIQLILTGMNETGMLKEKKQQKR